MALNNIYLDNAYQNKLDALTKQYEASQINNAYQNQLALGAKKSTNRASANTYQTAINPYGVQAEKMANSGLMGTGIVNRNANNAYSAFQNNLGNASNTYLTTVATNNNDLLQDQYNMESNKLSTQGDYNTNLYNEYNRLTQQEYQEGRDKVADKQWEKEYKLKKKQNSL